MSRNLLLDVEPVEFEAGLGRQLFDHGVLTRVEHGGRRGDLTGPSRGQGRIGGGRVVIEERLDGSLWIRFGNRYLPYRELTAETLGGSAPKPPEFDALAADASGKKKTGRETAKSSRPAGIPPTAGRSGRTPAEPDPPDGAAGDNAEGSRRPAQDHPWRKGYK